MRSSQGSNSKAGGSSSVRSSPISSLISACISGLLPTRGTRIACADPLDVPVAAPLPPYPSHALPVEQPPFTPKARHVQPHVDSLPGQPLVAENALHVALASRGGAGQNGPDPLVPIGVLGRGARRGNLKGSRQEQGTERGDHGMENPSFIGGCPPYGSWVRSPCIPAVHPRRRPQCPTGS